MTDHVRFQKWTYEVARAFDAPVFPDGCRDVIILRRPGQPARIQLTPLDFRPRQAAIPAGAALTGYRLRPGAKVSAAVFDAIAADPEAADDILHNDLTVSDDVDQTLRALTAPGAAPGSVSRDLGVSVRSVERLLNRFDLPPPGYWRLLARVRRAAGQLKASLPLADIACDSGFSDQAHMTREFARWFGAAPAQVRRNRRVLDLLCQPALGNWTGEQISTR
ncbi:MAG: AraC family transcriptional regulator [Oceanicaulis sp.]|nr:AraC family transcriptional regulator [Oceanicaulis sp.]